VTLIPLIEAGSPSMRHPMHAGSVLMAANELSDDDAHCKTEENVGEHPHGSIVPQSSTLPKAVAL